MAEPETECVSACQADSGSLVQGEGEQGPSSARSPVLAIPDMVFGADFSSGLPSVGDSNQRRSAISASGQDLAPTTRDLEAVSMAHQRPTALTSSLPRTAHAVDPVCCPLVQCWSSCKKTCGGSGCYYPESLCCTTPRELDDVPLWRHRLVSAFMRGVRQLRPACPLGVPSWNMSVVLEGLMEAPFEFLESASERILTLKVTILLALTSFKRVGDLSFPLHHSYAASSEPMKENVSGYLHNPCSLSRE